MGRGLAALKHSTSSTRTFMVRVGVLVVALPGCTGGGPATPPPSADGLPIAKALFEQTWPMEVVDAKAREPYESDAYVALVGKRNYKGAIIKSNGDPGLVTARFHADAAAWFRQATLASTNAYVGYFSPPLAQEYDPAEKVHLLLQGHALRGELDAARGQLDAVKALPDDSPAKAWTVPWVTWVEAGASWPPDLTGLPVQREAPRPGGWVEITERPTYTVKELEPGTNELGLDDPALLLQIALWHDAAARQAAGDQAHLVDIYGARYRLPAEPQVTSTETLPLEFRFGSDYLHPGDGPFMAAVSGEAGLAAVDAWKDKSFLAAAVVAVREDGKIDSVKAVDLANDLRKAWKAEQANKAGATEAHHPIFADMAVAGLYRNLALVAGIEGDPETSGKLRLAARDVSRDEAAAPEGLMALTAWDANNKFTLRGAEIIHQQSRRAPSLESVRTSFDLLGIRVGRSR